MNFKQYLVAGVCTAPAIIVTNEIHLERLRDVTKRLREAKAEGTYRDAENKTEADE